MALKKYQFSQAQFVEKLTSYSFICNLSATKSASSRIVSIGIIGWAMKISKYLDFVSDRRRLIFYTFDYVQYNEDYRRIGYLVVDSKL